MKAFPLKNVNMFDDNEGMDLRDYFASDLMKSFLTHERVMEDLHKENVAKTLIESAYQIADLMMEARQK
jgi:hypothetical protein